MKNGKKREFLLLAALLPGCVSTYQTDDLSVTKGFSQPHTFMSRKEGEDRLVEIAGTFKTKVEESWLVLQVEGHDICLWRDIGFKQDKGSTAAHVSSEYDSFFLELIEKYQDNIKNKTKPISFTYYHIHPIYAISEDMIRCLVKGCGVTSETIDQLALAMGNTPSASDFMRHIERQKKFYGKHIIGQSRVIGPLGVCSYSVPIEFMQKMNAHGLKKFGREPKRDEALAFLIPLIKEAKQEGWFNGDVKFTINHFNSQGLLATYERKRMMPKRIRYEKGKEMTDPVYVEVK